MIGTPDRIKAGKVPRDARRTAVTVYLRGDGEAAQPTYETDATSEGFVAAEREAQRDFPGLALQGARQVER